MRLITFVYVLVPPSLCLRMKSLGANIFSLISDTPLCRNDVLFSDCYYLVFSFIFETSRYMWMWNAKPHKMAAEICPALLSGPDF